MTQSIINALIGSGILFILFLMIRISASLGLLKSSLSFWISRFDRVNNTVDKLSKTVDGCLTVRSYPSPYWTCINCSALYRENQNILTGEPFDSDKCQECSGILVRSVKPVLFK